MRVHELARQLNISSKEAVEKLSALGVDIKNHMSAVDDAAAEKLRLSLAPAAVSKSAARKEPAARQTEKQPAAQPQPVAKPPAAMVAKTKPVREDAGDCVTIRGATVIVRDLAEKLKMRPNQLVAELMAMNVFAAIGDKLDIKDAQKVAAKHGIRIEHEKRSDELRPAPQKPAWEEEAADSPEDLLPRPPVVTFLGHVDHGKTSLLDRIRNTMVAKGEAGGITQHIGAYTVNMGGRGITFLDTPGHEAFTAMRARGAQLTDIAVIVVAADDGVMPQTKEAIQHALASKASVMVAINKMDLPAAKPDRVKQQLQGENLTPEEWGGETVCCEVSAIAGSGIEHLMEMLLLQADMLELKANPKRKGQGYVVEAQLESGMGPTANLLVKQGHVELGDAILCGPYWGRVKALINDRGERVKTAGPSIPVKCLGLDGVPDAGTEFRVCADDRIARALASERAQELRALQLAPQKKVSLENLFDHLKTAERTELALIVKADVQGSIEAILHALRGIKSDKVVLNIILSGVGNITVNDAMLASASNAIIVGFNVAKENGVNAIAKKEGVEIRLHSIIYDIIDEVRESMTGLLAPQIKETVLGHARVLEVFAISKVGNIAGCMVTDGRVTSRAKARVRRNDGLVFEGSVGSLRRFQNDAAEVKEGQECGIRLENFVAFEKGDIIEFYESAKIAATL